MRQAPCYGSAPHGKGGLPAPLPVAAVVRAVTQQPQPPVNSTEERLHQQRGRVIDAFVKADELIAEAQAAKLDCGPLDISIAERLAIRLLVKRFGWVNCSPGQLLRRVK